MKKIKLRTKLSLNKEVISELNLQEVKGGALTITGHGPCSDFAVCVSLGFACVELTRNECSLKRCNTKYKYCHTGDDRTCE